MIRWYIPSGSDNNILLSLNHFTPSRPNQTISGVTRACTPTHTLLPGWLQFPQLGWGPQSGWGDKITWWIINEIAMDQVASHMWWFGQFPSLETTHGIDNYDTLKRYQFINLIRGVKLLTTVVIVAISMGCFIGPQSDFCPIGQVLTSSPTTNVLGNHATSHWMPSFRHVAAIPCTNWVAEPALHLLAKPTHFPKPTPVPFWKGHKGRYGQGSIPWCDTSPEGIDGS